MSRALRAQEGGGRKFVAYALDYSCPNPGDVPFDDLIPMAADDKGATRIHGGEEGVTVLKTVLEVLEGFVEFVEKPLQLSPLWLDRRKGQLWSAWTTYLWE